IWQKGFQIAINCFRITETFPQQEKFGLALQINKSGVSIPSNIAEGSSRSSDKDYNRFIEISLGSCFEVETQLLIAQSVGHGDQLLLSQLIQDVDQEQKMLMGFGSSLRP